MFFFPSPPLHTPDVNMERYVDETDILIVGGSPVGLSAAIQARRLAEKHGKKLRVTLVEKASAISGHILSGACLDPIALNFFQIGKI